MRKKAVARNLIPIALLVGASMAAYGPALVLQIRLFLLSNLPPLSLPPLLGPPATTTTSIPTTSTSQPTTTTQPTPTTVLSGNPVTIVPGQPVNVPAGDYLLTLKGLTASSQTYGSVDQILAGSTQVLRDATFLASASARTTTADIRVSDPSDQFTVVTASGPATWSTMTLTPAAWSFVVRGQSVTSPTSANVTWHGVNTPQDMVDQDYANLAAAYPQTAIVRLTIDEECWDPFFVASQSSMLSCQAPSNGPVSASAYQARMEAAVNAATSHGEVALITLDDAGRDQANWHAPTSGDTFGPDQQSLVVYHQFAQLWGTNPLVVFETTNEPKMLPWTTYAPNNTDGGTLWLSGGTVQLDSITWAMPGVQQIVDQLRSDGVTNPIMVEGPVFGGDLRVIETTPVVATNLIYSFHAYNSPDNSKTYPSSMDYAIAPVIAPNGAYQYAGFLSEFGTQQRDTFPPYLADGSKYLQSCINFAAGNGAGWAAFGWYPTSYNNFGLLNSYQPLSVNSKGKTVVGNL